MCGRFTLKTPVEVLADFFGLEEMPDLTPRYNIAPTQPVVTVLVLTGDRQFRLMRWGLVPSWAKDLAIGNRMINARAETIAQKPSFRLAFAKRRCLIMADGFYEWPKKGADKTPYYITRQDGGPMAFAGLWERWDPPAGGEPVESCTIITTEANELIAPFHHRMPVILDPEHFDVWLDPGLDDPQALMALLQPYPAGEMTAHMVSTEVNRPSNDSPICIKPVPSREDPP